jgi:hypothetical protein
MTLHELDYLYTHETSLYDRISALAFIDELDEFFQNTLTIADMLRDLYNYEGFALCGIARSPVCDVGGMTDGELEDAQIMLDSKQQWCKDPMCRDELTASWETVTAEIEKRWSCPICGQDSRYGEHGVMIPATLYEPPDYFCPGEYDPDDELPY